MQKKIKEMLYEQMEIDGKGVKIKGYKKLCEVQGVAEKLLFKTLDEKQKELFDGTCRACMDKLAVETQYLYVCGFKLGVKLMIDVLCDE